MRFGKCEHPECAGHLAKFDNCLAEALYCSDEWDDTSGDVDYGATYGLVMADKGVRLPDFLTGMGFEVVAEGPLYAIVSTDSQGCVSMWRYTCIQEVSEVWEDVVTAYSRWLGEQGGEE